MKINCESVSLLRDRCYLIIERFNFESYKNSDNGVYLFEIKIDEHDITESINFTVFIPKNIHSSYLNDTSMSEQSKVNHIEQENKKLPDKNQKLLSMLENLNSHKINNTFPKSYNQLPEPMFPSDDSYLLQYEAFIASIKNQFLDFNIQYIKELKTKNG
jgi:hypothetical protein